MGCGGNKWCYQNLEIFLKHSFEHKYSKNKKRFPNYLRNYKYRPPRISNKPEDQEMENHMLELKNKSNILKRSRQKQ